MEDTLQPERVILGFSDKIIWVLQDLAPWPCHHLAPVSGRRLITGEQLGPQPSIECIVPYSRCPAFVAAVVKGPILMQEFCAQRFYRLGSCPRVLISHV